MRNPLTWLYNQFASEPRLENGSFGIYDSDIIEAFRSDPENLFLVSFPRTGSHWLRMLVELYVERPLLTRTFFYPSQDDYLLLHTHDKDLEVERPNVIYLYRTPVDTVYSQMVYEGDSFDDRDRIAHWADLYGRHLDKWLYDESFTTRKTILRYQQLKEDLTSVFRSLCDHLQVPFERDRAKEVDRRVTRELVKQKTQYNDRVLNMNRDEYLERRRNFRAREGEFLWSVLLEDRTHLERAFSSATPTS